MRESDEGGVVCDEGEEGCVMRESVMREDDAVAHRMIVCLFLTLQ